MTDADRTSRPVSAILTTLAGLLGAAGVAISAAAAHRGGGDLAATAGLFCLIHAAVVIGLAAMLRSATATGHFVAVGAGLLLLGTTMFAGELALAGLLDWRPLPVAAPIGGGAMIIGWLAVAAGGATAVWRDG